MSIDIHLTQRSIRAMENFHLLDPPLVEQPLEPPTKTETLGHWDVSFFSTAVLWTCRCGRSAPFLMRLVDYPRVELPRDLAACEVCRGEFRAASTKWQRLDAWLNRTRNTLSETECVLRDDLTKPNPRLRRRVYEHFWKKTVPFGHCVSSKCSNKLCINPYHLCLVNNPANKLTPESKAFLLRLLELGTPTDIAQQLLREKHSIELSVRSIQETRKGLRASRSCVT
jgi:hypothetical protein